ncbi:monofunctional biosynthetic peptidoglycan transglycosylase [Oxalobacter vibrioformis]|uniref:Biosynthetic peptidoglycan transglycosylase n=1 Tax=Oxalobacter vibrioformis TaxID=933080 RepID=A0A9E9M1E1_9BURK|nr:monofunctional biosynthetic peptidoglycan transglycosylase [Oxalobacter vibrioformis]WAW11043.1 monofunctional biosynthetic peptidoglycan transglycosylase [Oxalobacter vibrioformis]
MKSFFVWVKKYRYWILLAPVAFFSLIQLYYFCQIAWWVKFNPESTSFMRQQLAVLRKNNPKAELKHKWVPYNQISRNLKRAIIASEDANFSAHEGVDWEALMRAYEKNLKKGKVVAGGSTITQQLAKNLFLSGSRSYFRKVQELIITYMLEFLMDKERIFEIYLNVVEFGRGVFGAEAAARHYYGVSAAGLGPEQAARLAVMLPNPRYYGTLRDSSYLAQRTQIILRRMGSAALPKKPLPPPKKAVSGRKK